MANNSLDTIIIPGSLSYIGRYALSGNNVKKFILPASNTHELLYWIDNDSVKYNGGDTISMMHKTYTAVLGDILNQQCYDTLKQLACDIFISPSRKYIWTQSGKYSDTIPGSSGCDSIITIDLTIDCINSISKNSVLPVSVYPNPFNDFIKIEFDEICDNITIAVYDITGHLIVKEDFIHVIQLNYKIICKPGNYILEISDNKGKMNTVELNKQ